MLDLLDLPRLRAALARLKEVGDKATPGPYDIWDDGGGTRHLQAVDPESPDGDQFTLAEGILPDDAAFFTLARDLPAADLLAALGEVERFREESAEIASVLAGIDDGRDPGECLASAVERLATRHAADESRVYNMGGDIRVLAGEVERLREALGSLVNAVDNLGILWTEDKIDLDPVMAEARAALSAPAPEPEACPAPATALAIDPAIIRRHAEMAMALYQAKVKIMGVSSVEAMVPGLAAHSLLLLDALSAPDGEAPDGR